MSVYLIEFTDRFEIRPQSEITVRFARDRQSCQVFLAGTPNGLGDVLSVTWALTPGKAMEAMHKLQRDVYSSWRSISDTYDASLVSWNVGLCEAHGLLQESLDRAANLRAQEQAGDQEAGP